MSTQLGVPSIKVVVVKRTVRDHASKCQREEVRVRGGASFRGGYRGVAGVGVALIDRHCPADAD